MSWLKHTAVRTGLGLLASIGLLALVAGALELLEPPPGALNGAELQGLSGVHRAVVRPDGPALPSPALAVGDGTWRVALSGGLQFAYTGQTLTPDLLLDQGVLDLGPGGTELLGRTADGRWIVTLPAGLVDGEALQPRLRPDALVERFLLTPSEVADQLQGDVVVDVLHRPAPPVGVAAGAPAMAAGTLLMVPSLFLFALAIRPEPEPPTPEEVAAQEELERLEELVRGESGFRYRSTAASCRPTPDPGRASPEPPTRSGCPEPSRAASSPPRPGRD